MIRDSEYLKRIIPVIDIQGGVAVGAKGGNRDEYMPLESVISDSPDPVEVPVIPTARRIRIRSGVPAPAPAVLLKAFKKAIPRPSGRIEIR